MPKKLFVEVSCKLCNFSYLKRKDGLADWSGLCLHCSRLGRVQSLETRNKRSVAMIGKNKNNGHAGPSHPLYKDGRFCWVTVTCSSCDKEIFKTKESLKTWLGQCRECQPRKGVLSNLWRGGVTPANRIIRNSPEYIDWRKRVFGRDNFSCKICGNRKCYIEADHILPFSLYPHLRFELDNGRTLCKPCHLQFGWMRGRNLYNPLLHNPYIYISS